MITAGGKRNRATPDSYSTCPSAVRERTRTQQFPSTTYVSLRSNTSWVRHRGIDDRRRGLFPLGHLCSMVPSCFWGGRALSSCQSSLGFVPELAAPARASSSCCRVLTRLPQSCLWSFRSRWVRSFSWVGGAGQRRVRGRRGRWVGCQRRGRDRAVRGCLRVPRGVGPSAGRTERPGS